MADHGYWTLFGLDALTSLAFAGIILRGVPETRPARSDDDNLGSVREVLAGWVLLGLIASVVLQTTVYLQTFTTLPIMIAADGIGPGGFGLVLGLNGVLIIVLQPLLLGLLHRRNRGRLLLVGSVLQGGGLGLHTLAHTLPGHMAAVAVWTTGEVLQAGFLTSVVAELAPPHLRGRYMGAFGFSFGLATMLAPLAGTQVLDHLGEHALGVGCLLVATVSGVGLLRVSAAAARRSALPIADQHAAVAALL